MTTPLIPFTPARRQCRGFGIIMMLVMISLLAVFAVVATRLIGTTLGLYREAGRIDAEARWTDAAIRQLRADAWSANRITAQGTKTLTIDAGGGAGAVAWRVDPDGALVRTAPGAGGAAGAPGATGDAQRWPEIGARLSFEWDGAALTVRGADRGADRAGGIRMISQVKLAEAGGGK
jgi:hypothetical protein